MTDPKQLIIAMRSHLEFKLGRLNRIGKLKLDHFFPHPTIRDSDDLFEQYHLLSVGVQRFDFLDQVHLPGLEIHCFDIDELWVIFVSSISAHRD